VQGIRIENGKGRVVTPVEIPLLALGSPYLGHRIAVQELLKPSLKRIGDQGGETGDIRGLFHHVRHNHGNCRCCLPVDQPLDGDFSPFMTFKIRAAFDLAGVIQAARVFCGSAVEEEHAGEPGWRSAGGQLRRVRGPGCLRLRESCVGRGGRP
jgi:hypothetical protein